MWRGAEGQPSTLRAGGSGGGEQEGSQAHSEPGGVLEGGGRAANHPQSWEEWWRGAGGQPSTLRAGRSGGGGREGSQAHSEPGGVVEGGGRAVKHTQSREEWWRGAGMPSKHTQCQEDGWRGAGGHPSTLRAGRSGGGGQECSQTHSEPGGV